MNTAQDNYDELQATDDGPRVLLGRFDIHSGEALCVLEISPEMAETLAEQLQEAAAAAREAAPAVPPLSESAISEVTDFLGMMVRHEGRAP